MDFVYHNQLGAGSFEDQLWNYMYTQQLASSAITAWNIWGFHQMVTRAATTANLTKDGTVILNTWVQQQKASWFTASSFTLI